MKRYSFSELNEMIETMTDDDYQALLDKFYKYSSKIRNERKTIMDETWAKRKEMGAWAWKKSDDVKAAYDQIHKLDKIISDTSTRITWLTVFYERKQKNLQAGM